jgi:osmotically-inducible protein OsmY
VRNLAEQEREKTMTIRTRADEDIQSDVLDELKWDMRVRPNEIGVVTLTGQVDSYAQKLAAEEATHRIQQVKAVANDIVVHVPGFAERTDADLATAVLNALTWDSSVPTDKLDITVSNGLLTLKGEVEHGFQKQDAERAARRLSGIKGVVNQIMVRPILQPQGLKQNIETALVRNAELDASRIQVEVQGNKVILRGNVHAYAEKKAAEEAVWAAPAVGDVENHIIISLP